MNWVSSAALLAVVLSSSCASSTVAQKVPVLKQGRPTPELTRAAALRMTTAQLARLLFPNQPVGRFVSHEAEGLGPHGEPLGVINFFHRPVPIGADLCRRDVTSALFQPDGSWESGQDSPVRFTRAARSVQMAVAPGCRLKSGGYFAWVQPEGVEKLAPQALRRLVAFQALARAGGQLPIKVVCKSDDDANVCAQTEQALIANLPLDRIYIIKPYRSGWVFSVMPNGPGQIYWHVTVSPEGTSDPRIIMRWGLPAPF